MLTIVCRFDVISIGATKEEQLRRTLQSMKEDWQNITLSTSPYKYVTTIINIYILFTIH